jgi:hypothetical protein
MDIKQSNLLKQVDKIWTEIFFIFSTLSCTLITEFFEYITILLSYTNELRSESELSIPASIGSLEIVVIIYIVVCLK